jgi:hypothetical protein
VVVARDALPCIGSQVSKSATIFKDPMMTTAAAIDRPVHHSVIVE